MTAGSGAAGTQTPGTIGLSGVTLRLASCRVGPCTVGLRSAAPSRLVAGTYAEERVLSLTQPPRRGVQFGFDVELAVRTTTGWFYLRGYLSSGVTRSAAGQVLHLDLYLDLGTRTLPAVLVTEVAINSCRTLRSCP